MNEPRWEELRHYHICCNGCAGNPEPGDALLSKDRTKVIGRVRKITYGPQAFQVNRDIEWYRSGEEPTPTSEELEQEDRKTKRWAAMLRGEVILQSYDFDDVFWAINNHMADTIVDRHREKEPKRYVQVVPQPKGEYRIETDRDRTVPLDEDWDY